MLGRLSNYRSLYYECRFAELVRAIDAAMQDETTDRNPEDRIDLQSFKALAMFERGQFGLANDILKGICTQSQFQTFTVACTKARNTYQDGRYDEAEKLFLALRDQSATIDEYLVTGLSLANVYLSKNARKDFDEVIQDLAGVENHHRDDLRICLYLVEATADIVFHKDYEGAKVKMQQTIQESRKKSWDYFTIKGFYSLARLYQSQGREEAIKDGLAMLFCYLDCDQSVYLADLVRRNFTDRNPALEEYIRLNPSDASFLIGGQTISLQEKPLLFSFIEMLCNEPSYLSKERIAAALWPKEAYNAYKHNGRIGDLARRLKHILESFDPQPVRLISGRTGFRLSVQSAGRH